MSTTVEVVSFPSTSLAYYPFHFVTKQEDLCSSGHMEAQHGSSSIDQPEVSFEERRRASEEVLSMMEREWEPIRLRAEREGVDPLAVVGQKRKRSPSPEPCPQQSPPRQPAALPPSVPKSPVPSVSRNSPSHPRPLRNAKRNRSSATPAPTGVPPPPHATSPALAEDERPAKRRRAKSDWKEVPFRCDWEGCASTIPDSVAWQAHMEIAHNIPKADWSSRTERRCLHTRCVAARRGKAQAGTTYGEFPTLLRHYRTKHQLQELFRCSVPGCRAEFNRKDALGRHEKSCGSKNTAKENEPPVVDSEVDSDMGGDDESEEKLYERPPLDEDYDAE